MSRRDCTTIRKALSGVCAACGERVNNDVHVPDGPDPALYHAGCCPCCAPLPEVGEVAEAVAAARKEMSSG